MLRRIYAYGPHDARNLAEDIYPDWIAFEAKPESSASAEDRSLGLHDMSKNEAAERLRRTTGADIRAIYGVCANCGGSVDSEHLGIDLDAALAEERRHVIEQIRPLVDYAMGPAGASMAASDAVRAIRTRLDDLGGTT